MVIAMRTSRYPTCSPFRHVNAGLILAVVVSNLATFGAAAEPSQSANVLTLQARFRQAPLDGGSVARTAEKTLRWNPRETAIIVCDMWNAHWCEGASHRVAEMAPRMNEVLKAARAKGVLIVHAPSGTLEQYKDRPQRKAAQATPDAPDLPEGIESWCSEQDDRDAGYPVDQSDGGCDCTPTCRQHSVWRHQIDALEIHEQDMISDSGREIWNIFHQRKIDNVILMGVHTNMCVLGRPFGIRNMARFGKNVVLMRDLTDTMYNSRAWPYVSHYSGTDRIVEHIEKNWCPTVTSTAFTRKATFRFAEDKRPRLVIVSAEDEYETDKSLPVFANNYLDKQFQVTLLFGNPELRDDIPGIEALNDADLALVSIRRRLLPPEQLAVVRKFIADGKPIVGIRTASHAFCLRNGEVPEGKAAWPQFDREVFGGNYHGHHGNKGDGEPKTYVWVAPGAEEHPILTGVPTGELEVVSWLYKTSPLAKGTKTLLMGRVGNRLPHEPVAWAYKHTGGGRAFYTSMGHTADFEMPAFRRLLINGIYWAAGLPVPRSVDEPQPVAVVQ